MADDRSTTTLDNPMTGESTHPLAETGKEAGERASHLVERTAEIGFQQADRGLEQAASGVETVASSIRRVSTDMQTDQPQIADIASTAADQAENLANYLRETDVRQIIGNVESFARRQPILFLGGAFVLGLAASRFIKAAGGQGQMGQGQGQYGQGQWQSYGSGYRTGTGYGATGAAYGSDQWSGTSGTNLEATGPGGTNGLTSDTSEEL